MSAADNAASVSRGMRALLSRRRAELAAGASAVGWKIGFNTPAAQQHFGLYEPVVGYLTDLGVTTDGAEVSLTGWAVPAVEVEVAIRVGEEERGVAGLAPAFELVDLGERFESIEEVLGGNIWQRGVVFGEEVRDADPSALVASVTKLAPTEEAEGSGGVSIEGRVVEDPTDTVAFVRRFLAAHGAVLVPGDRIIAGSVIPPLSVSPGDRVCVDFGTLGELRIAFAP